MAIWLVQMTRLLLDAGADHRCNQHGNPRGHDAINLMDGPYTPAVKALLQVGGWSGAGV